MLSEISQTEKDKYCMVSLICGFSEKLKSRIPRTDWWLPEARGGGLGKVSEGGQKVQTTLEEK